MESRDQKLSLGSYGKYHIKVRVMMMVKKMIKKSWCAIPEGRWKFSNAIWSSFFSIEVSNCEPLSCADCESLCARILFSSSIPCGMCYAHI